MSEKQIKTALECLSKPNSSPADREKCYFMWKEPSCLSCYHEVAQNALALINSQEQRIKELGEDNEYLKTQLTATEARYESRKESDLEEAYEELEGDDKQREVSMATGRLPYPYIKKMAEIAGLTNIVKM